VPIRISVGEGEAQVEAPVCLNLDISLPTANPTTAAHSIPPIDRRNKPGKVNKPNNLNKENIIPSSG